MFQVSVANLEASLVNCVGVSNQVFGYVDSLVQEQNREVVTYAAGEYEQMPDPMAPGVPVIENEEHDARGVENSTCQQPAKARRRQGGDYRVQSEHTEPTHDQVDNQWKHPWSLAR